MCTVVIVLNHVVMSYHCLLRQWGLKYSLNPGSCWTIGWTICIYNGWNHQWNVLLAANNAIDMNDTVFKTNGRRDPKLGWTSEIWPWASKNYNRSYKKGNFQNISGRLSENFSVKHSWYCRWYVRFPWIWNTGLLCLSLKTMDNHVLFITVHTYT